MKRNLRTTLFLCSRRRRLVVQVGLAAEVEPERAEVEAVAAVAADLLERRQQLFFGRGPRVRRKRRGV
jgi:hypothetical protein